MNLVPPRRRARRCSICLALRWDEAEKRAIVTQIAEQQSAAEADEDQSARTWPSSAQTTPWGLACDAPWTPTKRRSRRSQPTGRPCDRGGRGRASRAGRRGRLIAAVIARAGDPGEGAVLQPLAEHATLQRPRTLRGPDAQAGQVDFQATAGHRLLPRRGSAPSSPRPTARGTAPGRPRPAANTSSCRGHCSRGSSYDTSIPLPSGSRK